MHVDVQNNIQCTRSEQEHRKDGEHVVESGEMIEESQDCNKKKGKHINGQD